MKKMMMLFLVASALVFQVACNTKQKTVTSEEPISSPSDSIAATPEPTMTETTPTTAPDTTTQVASLGASSSGRSR